MDFKNFSTINLTLATRHPILVDLSEDLFQFWFERAPKRTRRRTIELTKKAIHALIANLFQAHWSCGALVALSLNANRYHSGTLDGITYKPLRLAFDLICSDWDFKGFTLPALVEHHNGFFNRSINYKDNSKIQLNPDCLSAYLLKKYNIKLPKGQDSSEYLLKEYLTNKDNESKIVPLTNALNSLFYFSTSMPTICLRDEFGRTVPFSPTEETAQMEKSLKSFNKRLADTRVSIFISNDEFDQLVSETSRKLDEKKRLKDLNRTVSRLLGWEPTSLYRVFNQSSFEKGGRFYGGWWQNIPSKYRPFITINGRATIELDFKGLHPTMMYQRVGLDAPQDPYIVEGIAPGSYRKTIKSVMMALINVGPKARYLPSIQGYLYPEGWDANRMIEAIKAAHDPIAHLFQSGIGVELQKLDSDIADRVMREMRKKYSAVVLPVHDSFIVEEHLEDVLRNEMISAYAQLMGSTQIQVDKKKSVWDLIGTYSESDEAFFLYHLPDCPDKYLTNYLSHRRSLVQRYKKFLEITLRREVEILDDDALHQLIYGNKAQRQTKPKLKVDHDW